MVTGLFRYHNVTTKAPWQSREDSKMTARKTFTAASVAALKPHKKWPREVYDAALPGFGCRIMASGTKTWLLSYQRPGDTRLPLVSWQRLCSCRPWWDCAIGTIRGPRSNAATHWSTGGPRSSAWVRSRASKRDRCTGTMSPT